MSAGDVVHFFDGAGAIRDVAPLTPLPMQIVDDTGAAPTGDVTVRGSSTDPNRLCIRNGFTTLTRDNNVTAYGIGESVSDSATIGSVTALAIALSDTNDHPVAMRGGMIKTSDTGPGAALATFEMKVFNSNPTLNGGVLGGDNTAYSNKMAGYIGKLTGTFEPFFDGSVAVLTPGVGFERDVFPSAGGVTFWVQLKTLTAFPPSAVSLQYILVLEAIQCRP